MTAQQDSNPPCMNISNVFSKLDPGHPVLSRWFRAFKEAGASFSIPF